MSDPGMQLAILLAILIFALGNIAFIFIDNYHDGDDDE